MKKKYNINEFYFLFKKKMNKSFYDNKELENIFFLLVSHVLKCNKTSIIIKLINNENIDFFYKKLIKKLLELKKNKPIQYVIGKTYFFGKKFFVNKKVFIPRPETEDLVKKVLKNNIINKKNVQIFDIGTGSGCIGITIKKKTKN